MNWSRPAWLPMQHGKGRLSREPGAAMFQGLRVRLTLWYCGVLCAALVLFVVFLYFGVRYLLLTPVRGRPLKARSNSHGAIVGIPLQCLLVYYLCPPTGFSRSAFICLRASAHA